MSYEKDYIAARKVYLDKILPIKPTGTLKTFVEEERCKMLAKGLDDSNGNVDRMKPAHIAFNEYYKKYIEKIDTQIKKETVDKAKLKTPLTVYSTALKAISDQYLADFGKLFTEEARKAKAAGGALGAVSAGANAAANVAAERNLKRALEDFKAKRTLHLQAITLLSNETDVAVKNVRVWHATARDSVAQALNFAKIGQFPQAKEVADGATEAAEKATTAAEKLEGDYDKKITQAFQKHRDLGFGTYESDSSFGLLHTQEAAFKKGQVEAKAIFDKAVDTGTKTLTNIKSLLLLAGQAREAASAAQDAAGVKDIRPAIRSSLESAQNEMDKYARLITDTITNQRENGSGLILSSQAILDRAAVPTTRSAALAQAKVKAQAFTEQLQKIAGNVTQLEQLAKSQVGKVPTQLKNEEEFKTALARLGTTAVNTKRTFNLFNNEGQVLIQKLKALS